MIDLAPVVVVVDAPSLPDKNWRAELEAHWPPMPDLEGIDLFAEYPVTGNED